ncbi:MAG: 6-phospho-beta-glucosidase [Lachnospiraceae bacterium]|jgi:6-phospho-beta-glucosidase|nr:6-phospho-beta-glucosidase [Lachnospiraceae bacterium]
MGLKVVTIGGGSSYTPELVEGLIKRYREFPVKELWLCDIEEGREKLEIVGGLARRMVKKAGLDMEIHTTLDRREALPGADFVTTQFRVGGLAAREMDERIPLKYDVIGQETNGPGGMFKALRTIPVIFRLIRDCEELCPDAWIISFTNPAGIITEAVFRHTGWRRFIGLCNGPVNMEKDIKNVLHTGEEDVVDIRFGGINHMVFALDVRVNGIKKNEELIDALANAGDSETLKNIVSLPWSKHFLKGIKYYGIGYLRYYLQKEEMLRQLKEDAAKGCCRAQVVRRVEKSLFEKYADPALESKPKELEERGGALYSDAACRLMSSIYNDRGDIQTVNTQNGEGIPNMPPDAVVEISCVITKDGPKPVRVGELPVQIRGLIQQLKAFEVLVTDVALSGNYDDALLAMTVNPLVQSEITAKKILDEMLEVHKKFLPQF